MPQPKNPGANIFPAPLDEGGSDVIAAFGSALADSEAAAVAGQAETAAGSGRSVV